MKQLIKRIRKAFAIHNVSTRTFSRNEVDRLLKIQRDKCASRATHFANEKADSWKIFNYVNSTPIVEF